MVEKIFDVVFTGNILDGFDIAEVKSKAAQLFRLDEPKLSALFRDKPTILKKQVDAATAEKYQKILSNIGMVTLLKSADDSKPSSVNVSSAPAPEPAPMSDTPSPAVTPTASSLNVTPAARVADVSVAVDNHEANTTVANWTLDEPGSILSDRSAQPEIITVALPDFTIAPPAVNLLHDDEKDIPHAPLKLPAVDAMTMSDVGDDLLSTNEKMPWVDSVVDIGCLSIKNLGEDLLTCDEKRVFVEKDIDTSRIQLENDGRFDI